MGGVNGGGVFDARDGFRELVELEEGFGGAEPRLVVCCVTGEGGAAVGERFTVITCGRSARS